MSEKTIDQQIEEFKTVTAFLKANFDKINNEFDALKKEQSAIAEKTSRIQTLIENQDSTSEEGKSGGNINEEDLSIQIKKILFEDEDLMFTFKKIIENIESFNERKELIDDTINKKQVAKKKKSIMNYIVLGMIGLSIVGVAIYFLIGLGHKELLKGNTTIYSEKTKAAFVLPENTEVTVIKDSGNKHYFEIRGERYYYVDKPAHGLSTSE